MSLVKKLEIVLADTYALYLKTQNYHWNVEGARFKELHETFESHYDDLAEAIDTVAELIRGLGEKTPGSFEFFAKNTNIKPAKEGISDVEMVNDLLEDQKVIEASLRNALKAAEDADDPVVVDFLTGRLVTHRKNAWMLRSSR